MPIPVPPGALPAAHRVICMRAVRALARGNSVSFGFASAQSKKCAYCTLQNEVCRPVPLYVGREYEELDAALVRRSAAEAGGSEEDEKDAAVAVRSAAYKLASCVQVATAQVRGLQAVDVLLASHYSLTEEVRSLRGQVSELSAAVAALATAVAAGGSGSGRQSGPKGKKAQKTGAALLSAAGDLGGAMEVEEESELSEPPDSMVSE
ncbi:hypothetical protein EK21DRAFT_119495 [Setomelanomma holmii]|uniref:Uncharacterized protein n=1 Tax=Setomelanomma holmii TaxID=210430 RepID=A0A9P4LF17_9PLEO|nr:hypothetical protein EK21DRAFT_119495 [Setomelanomma holmii]